MSNETKHTRAVVHSGGMAGIFWTAGWMFTIAFAKLIWWKALLALFVWPYFLALVVR